jgi:CheY-like chemotaxis protein
MKRILVIEDSTEYREFIAEILRLCGFELVEAPDAGQGIRLISEAHPNLIICDLHLPVADGFSTLTAVRNDMSHSRIPFVILSADTRSSQIRRGLELGANAYLTKPIAANDLVQTVRHFLANGA